MRHADQMRHPQGDPRHKAHQALEDRQEEFEALTSSMLLRIQSVRCKYLALRARLYISAAALSTESRSRFLKQAQKIVQKLKNEQPSYAQVNVCLLTAAIAFQQEDTVDAIQQLKTSLDLARKHEMTFHQHAAMHTLGTIMSGGEGQELVSDAMDWMRDEGVASPDKMMKLVAPGFTRVDASTT